MNFSGLRKVRREMHVPASMGRVLDVCSVCGKMSKWHLCLTASHSLRLAELQASDQGKGGAPNFKAIAFKRAALSIRDYPVPVASGRDAESIKYVGRDTARRIQSILGTTDDEFSCLRSHAVFIDLLSSFVVAVVPIYDDA